ncbi:ATP-binding protein [Desulfopila sp. IMCC35006]|uniref:sensor histidine kinase n=1 Tax=Desulfopila sp. IMCC35006 TaxID=2569542 RepID=UPI00142E9B2F|nr:ATP-binding protein [Desulfopila sp. IMCC35006]
MMQPKKIVWQIFPASVLTILIAVIAVSWYGTTALREFYLQDTEADLEARANLISSRVIDFLQNGQIAALRGYCVFAGRESRTRITVVGFDGSVIADSNEDPRVMDNHRHRQEIEKAFAGAVGTSRRYSKTLDENLIYVAVPLHFGGMEPLDDNASPAVGAVLRTSVSVASLDKTLAGIKTRIGIGAVAVMLLAGGITLLISRNISKPLEQMTKSAVQFSHGDFSERMLPLAKKTASLEVITLAESMDRMAEQLDEKIQAIVTHRNQLETVFSSMIEAVIAIDTDEKIISINEAAAQLFDVDREVAKGRIVQQVVRNVKLQQQIGQTLSSRESIEDEIVLHDVNGDRFLQTHVVTLSNGVGENVGVLVVMNDVTRLRRLENVRRDFVANVSHELRTPITSIRGYVETLLDGALDIREDAERFLQIVLRQSERLTTIIDDLLVLSRIEEEAKQDQIKLEKGQLRPVIEAALQTCQLKADEAGIQMAVECPDDIVVKMNAALLEQALVNLLINAITYSKKGDWVTVRGVVVDNELAKEVRVIVRDTGCGIARKHLPRLFERFYRSDKARSRKQGGTGLGLAIVKHIAQAHNGRIEVASVEGEGSEFTLTLGGYIQG